MSERDEPEEPHVLVQLVPVHRTPQPLVLRDLVADDDQLQRLERRLLPQLVERVDQPLEVLVRLDVADVERERVLQLVARPHPLELLLVGRHGQPLVDRVVDDRHLVGRHVEPAQDVELRRFRHREDPVGAVRGRPQLRLRVGVGEPVRQVLREHQVDAVVDRHDRPAVNQRRQDVVRRVEQVDVLAPQRHRDAELLARSSRAAPARRRARKFPAGDGDLLAVLRPAEQHVLRVLVDPAQLADQVPDVGADPEVVVLPDVDGDTHQA